MAMHNYIQSISAVSADMMTTSLSTSSSADTSSVPPFLTVGLTLVCSLVAAIV